MCIGASLKPSHDGAITVEHKLVNSPVNRLRKRLPWLFRSVAFVEASPFGISNLANTNVVSVQDRLISVSYTHLRAHETVLDLVCRLLLEKKNKSPTNTN